MRNAHRISIPLLMLGVISARAEDPARPSDSDLIRQLGSSQFRVREAAHQALLKRDEAAPEIRHLMPSLDVEGRRRARAILEVMVHRRTKRILQYAREGRVDFLVEWSAVGGSQIDGEAFWQCVLDVAWDHLRKSQSKEVVEEFSKHFRSNTYADLVQQGSSFVFGPEIPKTAPMTMNVMVRSSAKLSGENSVNCILVARGEVKLTGMSIYSIVLANGDVNTNYGASCLIISDGNVYGRHLHRAAVIARGEVVSESDLQRGIRGIVSDAREFQESRTRDVEQYDLLYRPGEGPRRIYGLPAPPGGRPERASAVAQVDDSPPRYDGIRFFELIDLGFDWDVAKDGLLLTSLHRNSPLAKGGVRTGDVLISIDGERLDGSGSARRMLRRAFVFGGAELGIIRGGRRLYLPVSFLRWELPPVKPAPK
jgi:hypothetical protein